MEDFPTIFADGDNSTLLFMTVLANGARPADLASTPCKIFISLLGQTNNRPPCEQAAAVRKSHFAEASTSHVESADGVTRSGRSIITSDDQAEEAQGEHLAQVQAVAN